MLGISYDTTQKIAYQNERLLMRHVNAVAGIEIVMLIGTEKPEGFPFQIFGANSRLLPGDEGIEVDLPGGKQILMHDCDTQYHYMALGEAHAKFHWHVRQTRDRHGNPTFERYWVVTPARGTILIKTFPEQPKDEPPAIKQPETPAPKQRKKGAAAPTGPVFAGAISNRVAAS